MGDVGTGKARMTSALERLCANNVQERTNREIKRRSRVVQVFPSERSPLMIAGAVTCDQAEMWSAPVLASE